MASTKKLSTITYKELENSEDTSVWVLNQSEPRGRINFNVTEPNGDKLSIRVEITWIPIDLTTQATKKGLVDSSDLRRLVSSGMLKLLKPEECEEFMRGEEARKEAALVYKRRSAEDTGTVNVSASNGSMADPSTQVTEPSLFVQNLCAQNPDDDVAVSQLRSSGSLNEIDLKYVVQNSTSGRVKSVAAEMLAELQEG